MEENYDRTASRIARILYEQAISRAIGEVEAASSCLYSEWLGPENDTEEPTIHQKLEGIKNMLQEELD